MSFFLLLVRRCAAAPMLAALVHSFLLLLSLSCTASLRAQTADRSFAGYPTAARLISAPSRVDIVHDTARKLLYITSGGSVLRYDLTAGVFLTPFSLGGSLRGMDLSPDGNTLVVADSSFSSTTGWVDVVDLRTGVSHRAEFSRAFYEGGAFTVAFGNDGQALVSTSFQGSGWTPLRRFDTVTGVFTVVASSVMQDTMLTASGDGGVIGFAESNISDGPWGRYRVADGDIARRDGYVDGTSWSNYEIGVNHDGSQFAIPTYGGTYLYNAAYQKIATLGVYASGQPIGLAYHPVDDLLYTAWVGTSQIRVFDTNTFAQVGLYDAGATFNTNGNHAFDNGRMKLSRDGSLLFVTVPGGVSYIALSAPLTATDQSVTTDRDISVPIRLSGTGGSGGTLTYQVLTNPVHGTLSGTTPNLTYTPGTGYTGPDIFTFQATYGRAQSGPATVALTVQALRPLYRINCGGGDYTSPATGLWNADADYSGGGSWSFYGLGITGTNDPELYRDVRYGTVGSDFSYTLPATPGSYTLKLHFVEGDAHTATPGFRTFNVLVNGSTVLSNFDVFAQAGGLGKALDESIPVTAGANGVTVTFHTLTYSAMVSALELVPAGTTTAIIPAAPTSLVATAGNGQVALSWGASSGATSYSVKRSTNSGGPYTTVSTTGSVTGTSYTDTSVTNGATYYYVVTAVNTVGESTASNEAPATPKAPPTAPAAPKSLVTTGSSGQVALSWGASSGATSYNVKRATTSGGPYGPVSTLGTVTGTSFTDTSVTNGTTYYYVITAVNAVGESTISNEASATPKALPTAPAAPTSLVATAGDSQVSLSWNGVVSANSYNVKRSTTSGGPYATASTGGSVFGPSYTDTGLTKGTYYYVVTAVNAAGESPNSNEAGATPKAPATTTAALRINCGGGGYTDTVGNVWQADTNYSGGGSWSFYGLFTAGTSDPGLYRDVRYGTVGSDFSYTLPATPGNYTLKLHFVEGDQSVRAGKRTFNVLVNGTAALSNFDVFAAGGYGKAVDQSIPVTAGANGVTVTFQTLAYGAMVSSIELVPPDATTLPAAPTSLVAAAGNGEVSLFWKGVVGANSYNVNRATTSGGPYTTVSTAGTVGGTFYTDTTVTSGTTYYYVVTAVNAVGEGPSSNEAAATPKARPTAPAAPTSLVAAAGNGQVVLSWEASSGATSYLFYRSTARGGPYGPISPPGRATGTSFTDTSVTNGTTYYYVITAVNAVGESTISNEASATPKALPTAPAAPTSLVATAGNSQVFLFWGASSGANSYNVKRATTSGGPYATISTAGTVTGTSYTDTGLTNGTPYYYVVTAVNTVGEGPASNEASATANAVVPGATTLRINAGGGSYTSTTLGSFQADADYSNGAIWSFSGLGITGTSDPELYRDVRYGTVGSDFSYTLPAAPGSYTLKLHFVEGDGNAAAPGFRTFNVLVNGSAALSNLDVCAAAGGLGKALVKGLPVTVPAGSSSVTVSFETLTYSAMVSAIELVPASSP